MAKECKMSWLIPSISADVYPIKIKNFTPVQDKSHDDMNNLEIGLKLSNLFIKRPVKRNACSIQTNRAKCIHWGI